MKKKGNFSRDTFDKLKHYVGVRLQQGVPLVDADWNEQEDIRRYELRAFLKWFVGNGVPEGNDGFRIVSIVNKIILTSKKNGSGASSVVVNLKKSTAAEVLGFGPGNNLASRAAPPAAQLTGEIVGPFTLEDGMTLVVKVDDDLPEETVTFKASDFATISAATAYEVVAVIKAMNNLTASKGTDNDFDIKGGDGTAEGAGRCLVEGWDVINESYLKYTAQQLYENDDLAEKWEVDRLDPLSPPDSGGRTDTVYLDVWEREVDADEDGNLVNPDIAVETCVRLKREWVVRVKERATAAELPASSDGHVYYPLASLTRWSGEQAIKPEDITDLRITELSVMSQNDIQQIITDAYGASYNLDHDGQPNLKVSLREAINAILRGESPSTPEMLLTTDIYGVFRPFALEDRDGDIWVFWLSKRGERGEIYNICYNRYHRGSWMGDTKLTTDVWEHTKLFALEDRYGYIWVFWVSKRGEIYNICYNHYRRGSWMGDTKLTTDVEKDTKLFALEEDRYAEIWVFWESKRGGSSDIWYNRYHRGSWAEDTRLTMDTEYDGLPFALEDRNGEIWVFWASNRSGVARVWYNRYRRDIDDWMEYDIQLTKDTVSDHSPFAIEDSQGDIWVFWYSSVDSGYELGYKRYSSDSWTGVTQQITGMDIGNVLPFALEDSQGDIWMFWCSKRGADMGIWYKKLIRAI